MALRFADHLSREFKNAPFRRALRGAPAMYEHKAVAPLVSRSLTRFLVSQGWRGEPAELLFDWEGNHSRKWKQDHSYPVLGAWTHPDAAVLRPFTCALEIDREANAAAFKKALMKAAVHVLSGRYDALLFVYILKPGGSARDYLEHEDERGHTSRLLKTLRANGVFLTFS